MQGINKQTNTLETSHTKNDQKNERTVHTLQTIIFGAYIRWIERQWEVRAIPGLFPRIGYGGYVYKVCECEDSGKAV